MRDVVRNLLTPIVLIILYEDAQTGTHSRVSSIETIDVRSQDPRLARGIRRSMAGAL